MTESPSLAWLPFVMLFSTVLGPAVLMDIVAGRRRWRWAFGYPVDDPEDGEVWRRVRTLRRWNLLVATAAAVCLVLLGPIVGAYAAAGKHPSGS